MVTGNCDEQDELGMYINKNPLDYQGTLLIMG